MVKILLPRSQRKSPFPRRPVRKSIRLPQKKQIGYKYIVETTNDLGRTRRIKTFRDDKNPKLAKEAANNFIKDRKYRYPGVVYSIRTDKVKRGWL